MHELVDERAGSHRFFGILLASERCGKPTVNLASALRKELHAFDIQRNITPAQIQTARPRGTRLQTA